MHTHTTTQKTYTSSLKIGVTEFKIDDARALPPNETIIRISEAYMTSNMFCDVLLTANIEPQLLVYLFYRVLILFDS